MDWTHAFVEPTSTRIYLDETYWIEVKNELNVAEEKGILLASLKGVSRAQYGANDEEGRDRQLMELDLATGSFQKVLTYLLDWNLVNAKGKTIDISKPRLKIDAVKNLSPEAYAAIEQAIDAHVAARVNEKKATTGTPTPDPPSIS